LENELITKKIGVLARKSAEQTRMQIIFTNFIRIMSIAMIFIAKQVPMVSSQKSQRIQRIINVLNFNCLKKKKAVTLYWATSSGFSLLQNIAFKFSRVKKAFGIRETPSDKRTNLYKLGQIVKRWFRW